jgi:hypothetical protein
MHRLRGDRCVLLFTTLERMTDGFAPGRNGGHLTPYAFQGFRAREAVLGTAEAAKCYLLEQHTVAAVLDVIREHGLERKVDLVSGGHVHISESALEHRVFRRDYTAAQRAGLDVSEFEWLSADEVWEVRLLGSCTMGTVLTHAGRSTARRSLAHSGQGITCGHSSSSPSFSTSRTQALL